MKSTFLCLMAVTGLFSLLIHFQIQWQSQLTLINYLVYPLLIVTAIFATQFNRSRIAILCGLWLVFLVTTNSPSINTKPLMLNTQWLLLYGASLFMLLALIKDRALLSVHIISRLIFIGLCGVITFFWLQLSQSLHSLIPQTPLWTSVLPYVPIIIPLGLLGLLLVWRSISNHDLTLTALLITFIVWCLNQLNIIALPWTLIAIVMSALYLLAVSTDSYYLAYRDDLTGLPTRRALNQLALSLGRKYTVAMLDIDHFKKFNDTYGHDIGDEVLKLVATRMAEMRSSGKIYRYGGEEFTVVFPRKTAEQAIPELDKLRQSIANYDMVIRSDKRTDKKSRNTKKNNNKTVNVAVSIGVAQREPKQSFEQALKNADLALYRAKKKGRNNVSQ
ncbi:GGDEF domain-containing protein [Colwellia sp. 1_MG-2023]|uniref:GGDEF domain-containing protein n=1 Tax=unclassified Colwellia TaxID=196834 RepID=UPI0020910A56|nr:MULTISPECIES: GGDEF domain-containing protein [unclassified Colwellia]MDO6650789.1 GGDEF domain-containing protein [Colwellia sp. 3_MG-2023]MDO6663824.1 GGDEF domain-containing protein [Colwellia sp. 2_MG-2023]MDO6688175.1 GGDEF domain-containing protein [Colwellia sp. 1_MG-2023]